MIAAYQGKASLKPKDLSRKVEGSNPFAGQGLFSALEICIKDYSFHLALEYAFIQVRDVKMIVLSRVT